MKKRKIIPDFIFLQNEPEGHFVASVMLIDIVGFTRLTRKLMLESVEGAEILHSKLQIFFSSSLEKIYQYGGFVAHFEGDGFLAIFPKNRFVNCQNALKAAIEIQRFFRLHGKISTKFGNFVIKVRINISFGDVGWQYLKTEKLFFVHGKAIDIVKKTIDKCAPNQIQADYSFSKKFSSYDDMAKMFTKEISFSSQKNVSKVSYLPESDKTPDNSLQYEQIQVDFKGEFRHLIACFLQIKTNQYVETIPKILKIIKEYKGFFKDINVYKNEYKLLVYFGAPFSLEKIYDAAIEFSQIILNQYGKSVKLSLTFSNSFIGFFDVFNHVDFVAVSSGINLSARLLQQTDWGEITIDNVIFLKMKNHYNAELASSEKLKGFNRKISWYKLLTKKVDTKSQTEDKLVGRRKELASLQEFCKPLAAGMFAGICYLEGIAGIGKTYLLQNFRKRTEQKYIWFNLKGNPIVQISYQSLKQLLHSFFSQRENEEIQQNLKCFEETFDSLLSDIKNMELRNDLKRAKPALYKFLNLPADREFEMFSPEIQHRKMREALDIFFSQFASQKPLIIAIDDLQFLDDDTLTWLREWLKKASQYPVAIIATVRTEDAIENFSFFNEKKSFEKHIKISDLKKKEISQLISNSSQNQIQNQELAEFIQEKSNGNPLYAQQLTLFIIAQKLHTKNTGTWENLEVPADIRLIITARIEKLDSELKQIIKIAAVIGEKFLVYILSALVKKENLKTELSLGQRENILIQISTTEYSFAHGLICDTIYQMQMKKELRESHQKIAQLYREMYQINLDEYAATIAYHFEKAEDINNAIEYYKKAAVYAQKNFLNSSALHYLNKLLSYEKFLSKTDFMEFIINKIEVLKTIGQWKQAENLSYEALSFAETNHFLNQKADLLSGIGWLEYMKRNFEKSIENLDKAGKIYQLTKNDKGLSETIGNKAIILMRSQNFTEAEKLFKKKIEWDKAHSNLKGLSSAYLNYAVYLGNTNQLQKSKEMYNNGLEISNQLQDKVTQSTALGNLALIYMKENNLQKAKGYFTKTLQLALEIGDKRNLIYIYGHFGNYYYIQKKYIKAKDFFEKQLSAAIEIDFKHGIITALVNKKNVEKDNGNFLKAIELSDKALQLAKNSKNMTDVLEMLSHKGNLFYLFEYYNEACEIYKETLQTAQKVENSFFEYTSLYSLGKIFEETNLWEQSLDYFFKAKAIGDEKNFAILKNKCVEGIVSVNYQMGHYQQVIDFLYEEKKKKDSAPKFPPIVDFIQLKSEFMLENNDNAKGLILEKMLKVILIIEDITNRFEANFDIILLANYTNKHDVYQAEKGKLHQEIEEYLQKDLLFYVR